LAGLPLLMLAHGVTRGEDLGMRVFRAEVLDVLRRRFPDKRLVEGADEATIKSDGPSVVNFYLGNLFASVGRLPRREREEAVVEFFSKAFAMPDTQGNSAEIASSWEGARALLRPRLFPVDYLKTAPALLHRDFSRELMIGYSVDMGTFDGLVQDEHVKKWAMAIDTIHATAIANLEKLSVDVPIEPKRAGAGAGYFATVQQRDAYDAARLLLPEFRARVLSKLGDFVFAGIPNRDFLVLWSRDFAAHAGFVAQIRKDSQNRPYPLTDEIFVITADGVRPATSAETTRSQ
jgi:uncharacterized protein YtpQ (UPF0354 family)